MIKTRQPLKEFTIIVRDSAKLELLKDMESLIREELNIKAVTFDTREDVVVSISAKPNYKRLGRVYGPKMKDAAAVIETFEPEQIRFLEKGNTVEVMGNEVSFDDIEIRRTEKEGIEVETEGELTVALDTVITAELKEEGMAREFINRVQNLRKSTGLNVTDRIVIRCVCPEMLKSALAGFRDYVCSETLAVDLLQQEQMGEGMEQVEVDGLTVGINIERTRNSNRLLNWRYNLSLKSLSKKIKNGAIYAGALLAVKLVKFYRAVSDFLFLHLWVQFHIFSRRQRGSVLLSIFR